MKYLNRILFSKRSRIKEALILQKYASPKKTLEIGAVTKANSIYFPNLTTLNTVPGEGVDIVANAEDLRTIIADETYEIVLCLSVLEHTLHPERLLNEIGRILKKDGMLILSVPFMLPLHEAPQDYWRFTKYGLKHLIQERFSTIEFIEIMNTMESLGYILHRLFMQTRVMNSRFLTFPFYVLSKLCYLFKGIITKEYGSITTKFPEQNILAAGYYFIGTKGVRS
jgi:SAM-dependent methyltransferase